MGNATTNYIGYVKQITTHVENLGNTVLSAGLTLFKNGGFQINVNCNISKFNYDSKRGTIIEYLQNKHSRGTIISEVVFALTSEEVERPKIQNYFPKEAELKKLNETFVENIELYNFINALDNCIDKMEDSQKWIM